MIAVDASARIAILLGEPEPEAAMAAIEAAEAPNILVGPLVEALIAAERRSLGLKTYRFIEDLRVEVVSVTAAGAQAVDASFHA